jgi:hypothetical protein
MRGVFKGLLPAIAMVAALTGSAADDAAWPVTGDEFRFARMIYADNGSRGFRFGGGWWQQYWPEAEQHFITNLKRLTRLHTSVEGSVAVQLTDEHLFQYPWLYATQTGYWDLSDEELDNLREYLLRGGFLMCDDFWGEDEWEVFQETMARLFPTRRMEPLHGDDAVLHVVFSIDEFTQIPGLRHLRQLNNLPPPKWYGIYDDNHRLMVGINYNQDVGDSWEEADTPEYPQPMTALGYRFGINYIVYAMTH